MCKLLSGDDAIVVLLNAGRVDRTASVVAKFSVRRRETEYAWCGVIQGARSCQNAGIVHAGTCTLSPVATSPEVGVDTRHGPNRK
jgi:hypothetical protein